MCFYLEHRKFYVVKIPWNHVFESFYSWRASIWSSASIKEFMVCRDTHNFSLRGQIKTKTEHVCLLLTANSSRRKILKSWTTYNAHQTNWSVDCSGIFLPFSKAIKPLFDENQDSKSGQNRLTSCPKVAYHHEPSERRKTRPYDLNLLQSFSQISLTAFGKIQTFTWAMRKKSIPSLFAV